MLDQRDSTQMGHHEVSDDQVGVGLAVALDRGLSILREHQLVVVSQTVTGIV